MFADTTSVIAKNWLRFGAIVFVISAAQVLSQKHGLKGIGAGAGVAYIALAYFIQRSVLFDVPFSARNGDIGLPRFQRLFYILKFYWLGFLGAVPAVLIIATMAISGWHTREHVTAVIVVLCILFLISSCAVYALMGTWLPAAIFGEETGFADALKRGVENFGIVFFKLMGVMFLATAATVVLLLCIVLFTRVSAYNLGTTGLEVLFVISFAVTATQSYFVALTAVLFANEYKRSSNSLPPQPYAVQKSAHSVSAVVPSARMDRVLSRPQFGKRA